MSDQSAVRYEFSPIIRAFNRESFDCGKPALNNFLRYDAVRHQRLNMSRTWVLHVRGSTTIIGYYSLCTASVEIEEFPPEQTKRLPQDYPIPCTLLAKLAAHRTARGTGKGRMLLKDAITRFVHSAEEVASFALIVDAIDDEAASFYRHYGFVPFPSNASKLYLLLGTIVRGQSGTSSM